jgi:hypothetical protein
MTTRGIENQYKAYEEVVDELKDLVTAIENAVNHAEIVPLVAALNIIAVDAARQMEMTDEECLHFLQSSLAAAWNDYTNIGSPSDELH